MFHVNNQIIKDPKVIADEFCEYFTDISPNLQLKFLSPKHHLGIT